MCCNVSDLNYQMQECARRRDFLTGVAGMSVASERVDGGQKAYVRPVLAGSVGNLVEWYDWAIYAFLAPIFASQFFTGDPTANLLSAFLVFAVGFFMRPLGAAIIGSYADRFGRKSALAFTIFLMSAGSLIIGLTPTA